MINEKSRLTYIEVRILGKMAMYTDPVTRTSGEKISYPIPVYSSLKGVMESIYFDPSIQWIIDDCRVINQIEMESEWFLDRVRGDRVLHNYLINCEYQVRAHMVPNYSVYNVEQMHDMGECIKMAKNSLKVGGRRYAYLGTKKCPALVESQMFGTGKGYYDDSGEKMFSLMFYSYEYPEHNKQHSLKVRFWRPIMIDGIIHFCKPGECAYVRTLREGRPYTPSLQKHRGKKYEYTITL